MSSSSTSSSSKPQSLHHGYDSPLNTLLSYTNPSSVSPNTNFNQNEYEAMQFANESLYHVVNEENKPRSRLSRLNQSRWFASEELPRNSRKKSVRISNVSETREVPIYRTSGMYQTQYNEAKGHEINGYFNQTENYTNANNNPINMYGNPLTTASHYNNYHLPTKPTKGGIKSKKVKSKKVKSKKC